MSKKIIFLVLFVGGLTASMAQSISATNLLWTVTSAKAQSDSTSFNYACTFITYTSANTTLDWSQSNGESVTHFTVTSVDGQWADITTDGQVGYHVQNGKVNGTITFQKSGGVYTIHLQLLVGTKPDQDYVFSVTTVNPIN